MAVLLISEDTIKKSTTINGNVDVELLLPYIKIAQDIHVQQTLGTDLYDRIQNDIEAGSLAGAYKTLVDTYIQPMLVHYSLYECMPFLSYKIMNKSIVQKLSETSTSASLEDIKYIRNVVLNTAEFYTERLVDYLRHNNSTYPEYNTNTGADMSPEKSAYYSNMNLDKIQRTSRITLNDFLTPDLKI
ncbi:MAG: hypothetical protein GOVbin568_3 [Prokaryotic dsDNA virus sp.]|nr:MAG: hypothetical protein GOVbin568_3 [Prokaryotic dsDNA virus sp.]|tara:strand:+ start:681 stop:1241 length:561 start_codon:yes stop_codon:yes gene_type:complete